MTHAEKPCNIDVTSARLDYIDRERNIRWDLLARCLLCGASTSAAGFPSGRLAEGDPNGDPVAAFAQDLVDIEAAKPIAVQTFVDQFKAKCNQ